MEAPLSFFDMIMSSDHPALHRSPPRARADALTEPVRRGLSACVSRRDAESTDADASSEIGGEGRPLPKCSAAAFILFAPPSILNQLAGLSPRSDLDRSILGSFILDVQGCSSFVRHDEKANLPNLTQIDWSAVGQSYVDPCSSGIFGKSLLT